jgi:hypothetical protein
LRLPLPFPQEGDDGSQPWDIPDALARARQRSAAGASASGGVNAGDDGTQFDGREYSSSLLAFISDL